MHLIVGDIHGCATELEKLMDVAGYRSGVDKLVSVGDLVDRGPRVSDTLDIMMAEKAIVVRGNHDDKIMRLMAGRNVTVRPSMEVTVQQVVNSPKKGDYLAYLQSLPVQIETDDFVLVHAMPMRHPDKLAMFGPKRPFRGQEIRVNWWKTHNPDDFGGKPVFYGHYWFKEPVCVNNTFGLDTSCVAGDYLTGYIFEEKRFVRVKSEIHLPHARDLEKESLEREAWGNDWKEN